MTPDERRAYNREWMERFRHAKGQRPQSERTKTKQLRLPFGKGQVVSRSESERRLFRQLRYERLRKELIEYQRRWMRENPELVNLRRRQGSARRSHRIKVTRNGDVSYRRILERDGWVCGICHAVILTFEDIHFDHIVPLSKGGSHTEDNIQPSHGPCNLRKAARLIA